jgi:primase-polymerase (primpol)-like protein
MSRSGYPNSQPNTIPQELRDRPQWVAHRNKRPINPVTGHAASTTDPATWGTSDAAVAMVDGGRADGIGFAFTTDDPYVGIDLDHCRNAETGDIEPWAMEIVTRFASYTEITPSGTGLHILVRGQLPPGRRRTGKIETYDDGRYFRMSGDVLPGFETIRDGGSALTAWHREVWPVEPTRVALGIPTSGGVDDRDLIERLAREPGGKAARLLAGDATGYPSPSEARFALATKMSFYTDDVEQIARIIRSSGLFKGVDSERERDRKAELDARNAVEQYSGPRYDPAYRTPPDTTSAPTMIVPPVAVGASCDEQLMAAQARIAELEANVAARERVIVRERELRIAAEERANQLAEVHSKTIQILRAPGLNVGPRVTTFAVAIDLGARIANGEAPTEHGYRVPAVRIAEMTGQSEGTVAKHLREVDRRGLVPKHVVREPAREKVDRRSGEITVVGGDANYIPVPEGNIVNLIDRIIGYQRPELETGHGGIRTPACKDHPDAGTIKRWTVECAECHKPLDSGERHQKPDALQDNPHPATQDGPGINLLPEGRVVNTSYSGSKLIPDKTIPFREGSGVIMLPDPSRGSPIKMNGEPPPSRDYQDHDAPHWVAS